MAAISGKKVVVVGSLLVVAALAAMLIIWLKAHPDRRQYKPFHDAGAAGASRPTRP